MKRHLKNKKGFTLIELIVVIAILGILALIAIPRLSGFQATAKESADAATYESVDKAIAILVTNGTVKSDGTITLTTNSTGDITVGGTAKGGASNDTTDLKKAVEDMIGDVKFQHSDHLSETPAASWTITVSTGAIEQTRKLD